MFQKGFAVVFALFFFIGTAPAQDYATLYFYRIKKLALSGTDTKIYINGLELAQVGNGGRVEYRIYNPDRITLTGEIFSEYLPLSDNKTTPYVIEPKPGASYYFKGGLRDIEPVDEATGKEEYNRAKNFGSAPKFFEQERLTPPPPPPAFTAEPVKEKESISYNSSDGDDEVLTRGNDPLKGMNISNATQPIKPGLYYALIIGIDNYSGAWQPLKNAVNDARSVQSTLSSMYQFDVVRTLYNEQATRANIIRELEYLLGKVQPNDNLLIYYSGHGEFKSELNKGYWVPVNAKTQSTVDYISNSEIQTFLNGIPSKHTLLVSDACFSGDIFRGNTMSANFNFSEKYYTNVYSLASRQALTSGGIEPVMDGGRDGHSVFTYYFLQALKNNPNKYMDISQLYERLKIPVINNSSQTPKLSAIKNTGDEGGQFIFIKK